MRLAGANDFGVRSPCRWNIYTPRTVSFVSCCAKAIGSAAASANAVVAIMLTVTRLLCRVNGNARRRVRSKIRMKTDLTSDD